MEESVCHVCEENLAGRGVDFDVVEGVEFTSVEVVEHEGRVVRRERV